MLLGSSEEVAEYEISHAGRYFKPALQQHPSQAVVVCVRMVVRQLPSWLPPLTTAALACAFSWYKLEGPLLSADFLEVKRRLRHMIGSAMVLACDFVVSSVDLK